MMEAYFTIVEAEMDKVRDMIHSKPDGPELITSLTNAHIRKTDELNVLVDKAEAGIGIPEERLKANIELCEDIIDKVVIFLDWYEEMINSED